MKSLVTLAAVSAIAVSAFAVPQFAAAQSSRSYGSSDVCRAEQRSSANRGTAAGAVLGAILGGTVAGNGAKTEGAVLGAGVGAVAGHQIAKSRVKCVDYPRRVSARNNCRWVNEYYNGRDHGFEVCRGRDGTWRPSGRG
jgi:outer membrane lipoprotein SlyB